MSTCKSIFSKNTTLVNAKHDFLTSMVLLDAVSTFSKSFCRVCKAGRRRHRRSWIRVHSILCHFLCRAQIGLSRCVCFFLYFLVEDVFLDRAVNPHTVPTDTIYRLSPDFSIKGYPRLLLCKFSFYHSPTNAFRDSYKSLSIPRLLVNSSSGGREK